MGKKFINYKQINNSQFILINLPELFFVLYSGRSLRAVDKRVQNPIPLLNPLRLQQALEDRTPTITILREMTASVRESSGRALNFHLNDLQLSYFTHNSVQNIVLNWF